MAWTKNKTTFVAAVAGATYRGRLENGKLTGIWEQGKAGFQLDFARTNQSGQPQQKK